MAGGEDMSAKAKGLLLVMMDVDPEHEEEFNRWYWEEHVPERLAIEGFIDARRFVALEGSPKYLALYGLEGPEVLQSKAYVEAAANPSEWTTRMRKHYRPTRNVYLEIQKPKTNTTQNTET
jgi:hypothetical protein